MKNKFFLIVAISLIGIIILIFLINNFQNFRTNTEDIFSFTGKVVRDYNESVEYESLRFTGSKISYSISNECSESRANNAVEAFKILEDKTVLSFYEVNENPQITIGCNKSKEKSGEIVGEGGPTFIINTGKYEVILNGTVKLYEDDNCNQPIIATHEILHVIGFKHVENKDSIMYKISKCDQELTQDIIDEIALKYKDPVLPDMAFRKTQVEKDGRYINFEISIFNIGLSGTENADMKIITDDREIKTYNLNDFSVGSGKIIKVKNLLVPGSITGLTFIIDKNNDIPEINETNNREEILFWGLWYI